MDGPGCCSKKPRGAGARVVVVVVVAAAVVHCCCLLEIADVQILSQGDCLAKYLTVLKFPLVRPLHIELTKFAVTVQKGKEKDGLWDLNYLHLCLL